MHICSSFIIFCQVVIFDLFSILFNCGIIKKEKLFISPEIHFLKLYYYNIHIVIDNQLRIIIIKFKNAARNIINRDKHRVSEIVMTMMMMQHNINSSVSYIYCFRKSRNFLNYKKTTTNSR